MSPRYVRAGGVAVSLGGSSDPYAYVRPTDWLALPTVLSIDQKFVGLHAVYDHESNFVAVNCAGAYTVDWGDGSAPQNVATGVQANHNYVYTDLSSGTLSTRGYRQAIVTITPQAGQNLTAVNLLIKHNQAGLASNGYATGWLDIRMAGSLVSTLTIASSSTTIVRHRMLEQFEYVGNSAITIFSGKFQNCVQLRSIVGTTWTAGGTSFTSMFSGCSSLQTIPLLNTAAGTTFSSMFSGCSSLPTIPLLNTAAGSGSLAFSLMFNACSALQTIPLLNTGGGTDFSSMFSGCSSLRTIPLLNTAAGAIFTSMFSGCSSLQTIPLLNTAAGTNFALMFNACSALQTIPLLNTAAGTNVASMFATCASLRVGAMAGTTKTIDYSSCLLGPAALDAIYTNLASGVTAQTVTVTGNWGTASDTPAIATAKGWTVTGS